MPGFVGPDEKSVELGSPGPGVVDSPRYERRRVVPLLLLTTTGRKTGQRREIPLTYLREGDRLFLVGSNFGQTRHPAWSSNLLADPNAWVTMGGHEIPVVAQRLTGPESERIYESFADYASNYAAYRDRTDRDIRVFELTKR